MSNLSQNVTFSLIVAEILGNSAVEDDGLADYEKKLLDKLDAFRNSKNHKPSHSLLMVMITSMGLGESVHNRLVNAEVTLSELFSF